MKTTASLVPIPAVERALQTRSLTSSTSPRYRMWTPELAPDWEVSSCGRGKLMMVSMLTSCVFVC